MPSVSALVLGLAAATSAIDIRMWPSSSNCEDSGARTYCVNAEPNRCCGVPSGVFASVGFYAIPTDWYLEVRGHEGGNCDVAKTLDTVFRQDTKCLTAGPYTGAGYGFRPTSKRSPENGEDQCEGYQRVDTFVTEDGRKFSLVDLEDEEVVDLLRSGGNGTVPEKYVKYEIVQ